MNPSSSVTFVDAIASQSDSPLAGGLRIASMGFIAVLTAAAAQISVPLPFTEVPFTLQPMVVLLGGLALGPRLGLGAQLIYLAAGVAGLPVFAASATLPPGGMRLLGPTGGYLMSYPIAAFLTGYFADRRFDRRYLTAVVAMLCGLVVIYGCGAIWLAYFARTGGIAIGLQGALAAGVYPFVVADLLKVLVAAGVLPGLWHVIGRTNER